MGSASGSKPPSKPMRREILVSSLTPSNPNGELTPNPNPKLEPEPASAAVTGGPDAGSTTMSIVGAVEDDALARAEFLSREEVLRRRFRRLKQLNRCYRKHYWALMEEIRVKHRDYYWEFGKSPVEEDNAATAPGAGVGEAGLGHAEGENGSSSRGERKRCLYNGCKSKAMPLTSYCHPHILFDTKQTLYKACNHVINKRFYMYLIKGYAKQEKLDIARKLFDEMPHPNEVSWVIMIAGYIKVGNYHDAIKAIQLHVAELK